MEMNTEQISFLGKNKFILFKRVSKSLLKKVKYSKTHDRLEIPAENYHLLLFKYDYNFLTFFLKFY